jgi:PII-like signaling protein
MMVIAVGAGERIAAVLPELAGLLHEPVITLERVRVCKRDGELLATPHELPGTDEHGMALWQKLMVYTSNSATRAGQPLHLAIVGRLREAGAAGATSLRGIWGFHGDHAPHGDKLLQIRRHVPVCTIAIDTPERTARSFQIIDELTSEHGLVTSEMVPAVTAISESQTRGGLRLADHDF